MAEKKFEKFKQNEVKDQHQILTDRIIAKMEESVKYEKPWFENTTIQPHNPVTKTQYKGINFLSLLLANYPDPRFYTYNNIKKLAEETGKKIYLRANEKGLPVFKAMQKVYTSTDKETGEEKSFGLWRQVYAGTVFNASQIEGLEPLVIKEVPEFTVNEELTKITEAMIHHTGLTINHHHQGKAYYSPSADEIRLPYIEHFKSESLYQRTLSHELGHATGSKKRLERNLTGVFGSPEYAYEELIAELSSYFMGATIGFKYDSTTHDNHAAYLNSWLSALKKDKSLIFKASSAASKAVEYQINVKKEYYQEFTKEEMLAKEELIVEKTGTDDVNTVKTPKKIKLM